MVPTAECGKDTLHRQHKKSLLLLGLFLHLLNSKAFVADPN